MKPSRRVTACAAFAAALACPSSTSALAAGTGEWRFTVRLDDRAIGTHRFVVQTTSAGMLHVESEARFEVSLLGVPLYRYRHRATERWSNGCLAFIDARTDDNGTVTEVRGRSQGDRFDLRVVDDGRSIATATQARCLMTFAYWNPVLATQSRLLDPGSGRIETVTMGAPTASAPDLGTDAAGLHGLRIAGLPNPIDVWYEGGRWIGLDTFVSGGRHLSYRLD